VYDVPHVFCLQITFLEDLQIIEMISGEGEVVPFRQKLYPDGNVEDWLLKVEEVMKTSLRLILKDALADYPKVMYLTFIRYIHVI